MRYATLLVVLGLSMGLLLAGCGGGDTAATQTDAERNAKTPEDAVKASLLAFAAAIKEGNMEQAFARMDIPKELKDFVNVAMKASVVSESFQKKVVEAYGEDIVDKLGISDMSGGGPFSADDDFEAKVANAKIVVNGDTALVTHPDEDDKLTMKKMDGIWKLSLSDEELEGMKEMPAEILAGLATGMEGTAEVMQQMEPKIGSMTADEFVAAYEEASQNNPKVKKMAEAMGAMMMKAMQDAMNSED